GPDVLGNSYSCNTAEGCSAHTLQAALENLRAAGIFVVGTAGNNGGACGSIVDPPGLEDAVITVGSVDSQRLMAGSSGRGPVTVDGSNRIKPDLIAPGVSIWSSHTGSTFMSMSGTSMAVPHLAGSAALLWSAFPALKGNVDQTEALLKTTAKKITTSQICGGISPELIPNPVFGYGLIDVQAAYEAWIRADHTLYLPFILQLIF
ncbi:MAG: S8 family serine peptidase, partial [Desulfobacterota bacterium]|nr:S8 family serine peptidase [Thermodesulfobacteriota bacterium]